MANTIKLSTGLQEVEINGKRTIMINPTDEGFLSDLYSLLERLEEIHKSHITDETADIKTRFEASKAREKEQREAVDALLGEGFCSDVFGSARLYSLSGGLTLIELLLYGILDFMDEDLKKQQAARSEKIAFYTNKYNKKRARAKK